MSQSQNTLSIPSSPLSTNLEQRSHQATDMELAPAFSVGMSLGSPAAELSWIWHGYIAAGNLTVLTSQWKSGKTTLVATLLARMAEGGDVAGLAVKRGRAFVISEESPLNWQARNRVLQFGNNFRLLCRPFKGRPSQEEWTSLVDGLIWLRETEGLDLVVVDPLANFLPGCENVGDSILPFLLTLQRLTSLGVAVLIVHHPRKGEVRSGQAARGSGVLGGYADILLEMRWYSQAADDDNRRVIEGYSRHDETPKRLVIGLTADRKQYISHGDLREDDLADNWMIMHAILADSDEALTRAEIRKRWPGPGKRPDEATVWRWLEQLVGERLVAREGKGRRGDPYRFRLGQEAEEP
jgi:AAA domain-containing protein